jgi:hypothetical protein
VAIALRGIPSYSVVPGACTMTMPPSPLTARTPCAPSLPVPDSTMQIARSRWSWARERKKKSMGRRCPRGAEGSSNCRAPLSSAMSRLGGMMYAQLGSTRMPSSTSKTRICV